MKNFENLTNELNANGFKVALEPIEVVKNSVPCKGIRIINPDNPGIAPVVYYSPEDSMELLYSRLVDAITAAPPAIDMELISDRSNFAKNAMIAVVKRDGESDAVIRKHYLNIDVIMRLVVSGSAGETEIATVKVTDALLKSIGITEDEAWAYAEENSKNTARTMSVAKLLGFPENTNFPLYVASVNGGHNGAAAICYPGIFQQFCNEYNNSTEEKIESLILLPSSTEEILFCPDTDYCSIEEFLSMVEAVNSSEVADVIQLTPAVYKYSLCNNEISLIAAY